MQCRATQTSLRIKGNLPEKLLRLSGLAYTQNFMGGGHITQNTNIRGCGSIVLWGYFSSASSMKLVQTPQQKCHGLDKSSFMYGRIMPTEIQFVARIENVSPEMHLKKC